MLSNISDLFTMASLVICMLLSGIIFYYLRTRISMLEQSVMDQAQLLQQVVTSLRGCPDILVQNYLVGLGGGDVTPALIGEIVDELKTQTTAQEPIWKETAA